MNSIPGFDDLLQAHGRIKAHTHITPVLECRQLNSLTGASLYFKCENFQRVGAFKFRGALNTVLQLSDKESSPGVATHSSGNHGQAVALAAKMSNIPATIVMPENAPSVKVEAVKGYDAQVKFCESSLTGRKKTLEQIVRQTGAYFVHPYNDGRIIAGQGTATLELFQEVSNLDIIMAPVGGGGLISGTAIAANRLDNNISVIGVQPRKADDAFQSLKAGCLIPGNYSDTIADGLRTSLGELTFRVIQQYVDSIVTVSEESIILAMRLIWERMKIIVEPSCAVPLAALLENKIDATEKNIGIILSGGNVDLDKLPWQKR